MRGECTKLILAVAFSPPPGGFIVRHEYDEVLLESQYAPALAHFESELILGQL